jgi:hypothetical protein
MAEGLPPPERAIDAYKRLAASAEALSTKSDEYARVVALVDHVLRNLNLGITAWERINGSDDDGYGNYWSEDVGYAKVDRKWGIAIRTRSGSHSDVEDRESEMWLFNDAPRPLRIDAIDKIPDLMEKLIKAAEKTTKKIDEKMADATKLADALQQAAQEVAQERKARRSTPVSPPPSPGDPSLVGIRAATPPPRTLGGLVKPRAETPPPGPVKGTIPVTLRSEKK